MQVIWLRKNTGATKSEGQVNSLSIEKGIYKCGVFMALNQNGGTKCTACETEQPGNEGKLYVSISEYGSDALAY